MANKLREAAKAALDAWEAFDTTDGIDAAVKAFESLRAALDEQGDHDDVIKISEALRQYGLTLVRTGAGFRVVNLGQIEAQGVSPAEQDAAPVAWMVHTLDGRFLYVTTNPSSLLDTYHVQPLYTHQRRRAWRSLTNEEIKSIQKNSYLTLQFARAIESKLMERNND